MKSIYFTACLFIALLFSNLLALAQDFPPWPVPDEAAAVENPVEATKESIEAGKSLYDLQCKACHGDQGKGDGLIKAASLVSEDYQKQSDGAVFWKLQQGRGQMPSFSQLPDEQLWNVINYVRTLSKDQEDIVKKEAAISMYFNEKGEYKEVTAKVEETLENGEQVPGEKLRVDFFVDRYFGELPFAGDKTNYTNENGEVTVVFPNDIIGDENGDLTVIARLNDMEYVAAEAEEMVTWGLVNPKDYWTERRSLWKNNAYVPIWLLITFIGGAIGVWSVIIYVALLVRKIKLEGDRVSQEES